MLEKAAAINRFKYSPLGSELKKKTDIAKTQYQGLDKFYKFDKKEEDETKSIDKTKKIKSVPNQISSTAINLLYSISQH